MTYAGEDCENEVATMTPRINPAIAIAPPINGDQSNLLAGGGR
jgi:hypothetical protein